MADSAVDGRRLNDEPNETQAAFSAAYGDRAAGEWIRQHNAAIGFGGDPDAQYVTGGGIKTITQIGRELRGANYPGPWNLGAMLDAYGRASGQRPSPYGGSPAPPETSPQPSNPTAPSTLTPTTPTVPGTSVPTPTTSEGPPVAVTGNFGAWLGNSTAVFGVRLPNTLIAGVPIALVGAMLLQQRPVTRRNPAPNRRETELEYGPVHRLRHHVRGRGFFPLPSMGGYPEFATPAEATRELARRKRARRRR